MASIELYNNTAAFSKIGYSISAFSARVARWNETRKTRAELYKLTLRELDDIGIAYGDIKNIR